MSIVDLRDYGIVLRGSSSGNTKTYCPQCRNSRKSKNKNDLPLSVTINNDGAVWNCHNCGWTGGMNNKTYNSQNIDNIWKKQRLFQHDCSPLNLVVE